MVAMVAWASYRYGAWSEYRDDKFNIAYVQTTLAFAHYDGYQQIESLLLRKCYEAALTQAQGLKNEQLVLMHENLRATGDDPDLVEYLKVRDPKVLEALLAGRVPELKPWTTTCP